jgi:hypothetical protein
MVDDAFLAPFFSLVPQIPMSGTKDVHFGSVSRRQHSWDFRRVSLLFVRKTPRRPIDNEPGASGNYLALTKDMPPVAWLWYFYLGFLCPEDLASHSEESY